MSRHTIVKTELERIYQERSRLTAGDVLEEASEPESPLHTFFEWDDSEAAERYRLVQAAGLIRSVKVRVTRERAGEVEDLVVRGWVAARATGTDSEVPEGYVPETLVEQRPELREAVLRQMRRDLTAAHRRYQHITEYWELVDELAARRDSKAS